MGASTTPDRGATHTVAAMAPPARHIMVLVVWYGMVWYGMVIICSNTPLMGASTTPDRGATHTVTAMAPPARDIHAYSEKIYTKAQCFSFFVA